jgi:hypothetical protein
MRRVQRVLLTALLSLGVWATLAGSASGQRPARSGLWLENGVGSGTARNACSGCESVTAAYGSASHLRAGVGLTARVLIGIEVFAFNSKDAAISAGGDPLEAENVSIAPIVIWYAGDSGFFVKGGVGLAKGTFTVRTPSGETTARGTGSGMTFGIGFDVPVLSWLALTANLGTYVAAIGDVRLGSTVVDDVIATLYEAGVSVTLR